MINLDRLTSTAIRAYADQAPALQDQIVEIRTEAGTEAQGMTRMELVAYLTEAIPSNKHLASSKKDILVALYRGVAVNRSAQYEELKGVELAANADRWTARKLNKMIRDANEAQAKVAEQAALPNGMFMLAEYAQEAVLAAASAKYAHSVVGAVNSGVEITEATETVAREAMRTVLNLAEHVLNNGARAGKVNEAVGARRFLNEVSSAYGDTITVSLSDVR